MGADKHLRTIARVLCRPFRPHEDGATNLPGLRSRLASARAVTLEAFSLGLRRSGQQPKLAARVVKRLRG
jgi:hypothetical protein